MYLKFGVDKHKDTFENINIFVDSLEFGELRPFNNETVKCETLSNTELDKALSGQQTVEEMSENIVKGVDEIMSSN